MKNPLAVTLSIIGLGGLSIVGGISLANHVDIHIGDNIIISTPEPVSTTITETITPIQVADKTTIAPIISEKITSYQQIKEDMINDNNISQVNAYILDLDTDGSDEMVVTYKKGDTPAIRIYYKQNDKIIQLCDYTGSILANDENPAICYMITKENQGYSLRERVKEENKVRNTYYELKDNSLIDIRNIPEKDNYSDVIPKLQKYPIVITTDPIHYPITEGVSQPPKI